MRIFSIRDMLDSICANAQMELSKTIMKRVFFITVVTLLYPYK